MILRKLNKGERRDFPKGVAVFKKGTHESILTQKDINELQQFIKFIKPIPLTEEWLVKNNLYDGFEINECKIEIYQHFAGESIWFINAGKLTISIKYVHQLQNLYFALTGECS